MRAIGLKIWNWCFDKSLYVTSISFIILTIIDISDLNNKTVNWFGIEKLEIGNILYYSAVIIAIVFGFFSTEKTYTLESLEKKLLEESSKTKELEDTLDQVVEENIELFNSYLKLFFKSLNLTHSERISVYKVYEEKFHLMGRASENPTLEKPGRPHYPINEGYISFGWERGYYYIDNLPEIDSNNGQDYFKKVTENKNISIGTVRGLKMHSRNYLIVRMNGYGSSPKAVIVFESLLPNSLKEEEIKEKLDEIKDSLVEFIEKNSSVQLKNSNLAEDIGL